MKIYEYARERNIKSRDIVKKLHELGFTFVKNHLSLVPGKVLEKLDSIEFTPKDKAKKKQNIIIVTLECAPFTHKGISSIVRKKIKAYNKKRNNLSVILPKYDLTDDIMTTVFDFKIEFQKQMIDGIVYHTKYESCDYYFVDSPHFKPANIDNEYLAFFGKAVLTIINNLRLKCDIINIHDWQTGLYPLIFKEILPDIIVEFSVYGATYQGIYDKKVLTEIFGLDEKYYELTEYAGSINFLKAGLLTSDKLDINNEIMEELKTSYLRKFVFDN